MQVDRNKPIAGSEARRFTAGPAVPRPEAKSFAAALKQAGQAALGQVPAQGAAPDGAAATGSRPATADAAAAPRPAGADGATGAPDPGPSPAEPAVPAARAETAPTSTSAPSAEEPPVSFADHMEMVRYRLKTGYYDSKAIEDALTEKLSGYFDDLG